MSAKLHRLTMTAWVAAAAVLLGACGGSPGGTQQQAQSPPAQSDQGGKAAPLTVKIGVMGPFSGQLAEIGVDALNAAKLAVEEFNAKHKDLGLTVQVEAADDANDGRTATTVAQKLADDPKVMGVIGPMTSGLTDAVYGIWDKVGLVMITQSATNPKLSQNRIKVFHRVTPKDDDQGPAAGNFIANELKAKKLYLIDDKGQYGQGLADQVEATVKKAGVQTERGQISDKDQDFSAVLTKAKAFGPDVLYFAGAAPAQAASLLKQARALGINATFMTGEAMVAPGFLEGAGDKAEGTYMTNIGPLLEQVPQAQEFVKRYKEKHKQLSVFTGQTYDATNILLTAILKAYQENGGKVDRATVLKNVKATKYTGVLGVEITFNEVGDLSGGSIFLMTVKDGKLQQVKVLK